MKWALALRRRRLAAAAFNLGPDHDWVRFPEEVNLWWVCAKYHVAGNSVYAEFSDPSTINKRLWRSYKSLEETPDLFVEFARLYEEADFDQAALS